MPRLRVAGCISNALITAPLHPTECAGSRPRAGGALHDAPSRRNRFGSKHRVLSSALVAIALASSGCGLVEDHASLRGVPADLELMADPVASAKAETRLVEGLAIRAGVAYPDIAPQQWDLIFRAGVRMVDGQCDQYLAALFRFNREQRAGRQGLTAIGATTAVISGLAGVGAIAIAITAAAFGLAASLFDASVGSVLFTIEPSALRNVVLQGRKNYLEEVAGRKIESRPDAMIAIQGYLTQCSPAAIEANINNAANGSRFAVTSSNRVDARNAAVAAAPGILLTREQRAQTEIKGPVNLAPQPTPQSAVLTGARTSERNVSSDDLANAQRALGVKVTRQFDQATRSAIGEFEKGMIARAEPNWKVTEELSGRTGATLSAIKPLSGELQSPFEYSFMSLMTVAGKPTTEVDIDRAAVVWGALFRKTQPPQTPKQVMDEIRAEIAKRRGGKTALDSELWSRIELKG